ncbi:MAG TPA: hypothetical protein VES19_00525 [Candidatus Limnocylindrales bacterium]|nr:hypothetical protein [Candidatus Limnocylindrales bacterium]
MALLFVLPGLAWGPVMAPGSGSSLVTAGRAAGASLLVTGVACTVLGSLGLFSPAIVAGVLVAVTVVPFALPARRRALVRALRGWRGTARRRRIAGMLLAVGAIAITGLVVLLPSRQAVGDALLPFSSTVWYYANLARETAVHGGFPVALPEWGTLRPFQVDYLPATAHAAAAFALLPGFDLRLVLEVYRLAVLATALAVAALLFRRFVSSWIAVLGSILLLATVRLEGKFLAYRPETWALVPALFTLWLADRAMAERSRRLAAAATAAAALTWLAHAEVFLLLGPGIVGLAAGRLLAAQGRVGLRMPPRRVLGPVAGVVLAVFVGGMIGGAAASFALTGELRIVGYVARDRTADARPPLPPADEIPPGWSFTDDPTWDFNVAAVAPAVVGTLAPDRFTDSRLLPRSIAWIWPGLDGRNREGLLLLIPLCLAPVLGWRWLDARRRRAVLLMLVFGVALLAGSYLLFLLSSTYVPMRTGPRRLMPYELLVPVLAAIVGVWSLDRLVRPGWRALLPSGGRAGVAAALAAAILVTGAVAPAPAGTVDDAEPGLTTAGYEAYRWIAANLPPDARILANAYTDGSVAALTERTGIVDGRAVYLEDPEFLADSTNLVLGARTLFLDPGGAFAGRYLAANAVGYVLVVDEDAGGTGADLGGYSPFDTDAAALGAADGYTLVRSFAGGRLLLYAVASPGAAAHAR